MSVFHLINKTTLGESSKYGPSLTSVEGQLVLGWIGLDGQMNTLLSADNGLTWGNKKTAYIGPVGSGESQGPPPIGNGGYVNGASIRLVAFRYSSDNSLHIGTYSNEIGPQNGSNTAQYTDHAPGLSNNFIAWTGSGNPQLNIGVITFGLLQGSESAAYYYRIPDPVVSAESSDGGPCLCDFNGETLIGWRGSGNFNISVAQVSTAGTIVNKKVLGESSDFGPTLAGVGSNLYLAWTGSGNPQLNIMSSPNGYDQFGGKVVLSDSSGSGPALASNNNVLVLAWRGSGNDSLNVAQVAGPGLGGL